jgi:uncharacterized protein (DUF2147 family)
MKLFAALSAAAAMLTVAGAAHAADATGLWATQSDNGRVQIYRCGEALCGKLVDADQIRANPDQNDHYNKRASERSRKVKGLVLFKGYTGGPTEWQGGEIYDPKTGDTGRTGRIKLLSDDKLQIKGCLGPFCRTQQWKRVG